MQRAAGHGDPRVDLQALARDDRDDLPVGAREHVERVLRPRQVLLHEQRAVALERLQLGAALDQPDAARAAAGARLDDHRQLDRGGVERVVDDDGRGHAHVLAAALGQHPLVEAGLERRHAGEHERGADRGELLAALRQREQLGVDGRDHDVDRVAPALLQQRVGEARVVAAQQDRAAGGLDEVEAGGERVDVARQHRHGLAVHGAQDRDARRAAGAGHEHARGVSRHRAPPGVAAVRDGGGRVAVAHHLERLDVARLAEARPVAGGRAQQLLVEVVADLDLRREGPDDLDLALEELVDGHEARRLELDAGGRRLVTEDARDAAGGDQRRAVRVAVVLVDVADRVRVDRRRPDLLDHVEDRADRRAALADAGVGRARRGSAAPTSARRPLGLGRAVGRRAALLAAGERQERHAWPCAAWRSRIPPMPISTSSGCAPTASTTSCPAARRSRVTATSARAFSTSVGGIERLGHVVVGAGAHRRDRVVERAVAGQDQRRQLRPLALDAVHELEAVDPGQVDVADHQVPVAARERSRAPARRWWSSARRRACRAAPRAGFRPPRRLRRGGCVRRGAPSRPQILSQDLSSDHGTRPVLFAACRRSHWRSVRGRAWTYDSAVTAAARAASGDIDGAAAILDRLQELQRPDGALDASYDLAGGRSCGAAAVGQPGVGRPRGAGVGARHDAAARRRDPLAARPARGARPRPWRARRLVGLDRAQPRGARAVRRPR